MAIELSTITFTDGDDIFPPSGVERILNTGVANTLAGNDTITGTGDTNKLFYPRGVGILNSGTLNTAEGNDIITGSGTFRGIENTGTLNTAEGNDTITGGGFHGIDNYGTLNTAEGNDIITASGSVYGMYNDGTLNTAEGNDLITAEGGAYGIYNGSFAFNTGDGNDTIEGSGGTLYDINNNGFINTGDGDDLITGSGSICNEGIINTGNGEDSISQGWFYNYGGVFLGDGNDSIILNIDTTDIPFLALQNNSSVIETEEGDDTITSTGVINNNEGVINTGNGNDSIIVDGLNTGYGIYNNGGIINTGNGNDIIIANRGFGGSETEAPGSVFLGNGEDYLNSFGSGDFFGGNNEDTLELLPGSYTVGVLDTTVTFTKDNQLMKTSEFEQLIAGGTTYLFANLTQGQIIVVA
jgi:Ca2+-binding RTX toxin-like protein